MIEMKRRRDCYGLQASPPFSLESREEEDINLQLCPASHDRQIALFGTVKDACSQLIAGATVKVFSKKWKPLYHTYTDSRGCYSFDKELVCGTYYVTATAEGYVASNRKRVAINCCAVVEQSFTIKRNPLLSNAIVYGKVLRQVNHNPIGGSVVQLLRRDDVVYAETISLEDGEYLFYDVKPGRYKLLAHGRGYECQMTGSFMLRPGSWLSSDMELRPITCKEWGTVSGRVRFGDKPTEGIPVFLFRLDEERECMVQVQMTQKQGVYLFGAVEPGSYRVKAAMADGTLLLYETRQVNGTLE